MNELRLRWIHLDFHTPAEIPDVGKDFDPRACANLPLAPLAPWVRLDSDAVWGQPAPSSWGRTPALRGVRLKPQPVVGA